MLTSTLLAAVAIVSGTVASSDGSHARQPVASGAAARPDIPQIDAYEERTIAGFRVLLHRDLAAPESVDGPRVIAALTWDLELLIGRVPEAATMMLRRTTPIWVTPDLPSAAGWNARGLCHHPSREWLVDAGYGADRAGAVEVCDVGEYLLWRAEQPLCVLHEMAHALQHELGDPPAIREAFSLAEAGGRYEHVPFALLPSGQTRRAYALNNHVEYFAEVSEAYFGRNDYFPFTREDLARADPGAVELVRTIWAMPGVDGALGGPRQDPGGSVDHGAGAP